MIDLSGPDLSVGITTCGARIAQVRAPDRHGVAGDVVIGLDEPGYATDPAFLGATVGRFANRIAGGRFELDGRTYAVPCNEPGVALHGGPGGFDRAEFRPGPVREGPDGRAVTLHHSSPDGDNGFPGTLEVAVTYAVTGRDLAVGLLATTDAPTVVNLTNHAYVDLGGTGAIEGHEITVFGSHYLPVDDALLPTGEIAPVEGTPFDLRTPTRIGTHLRRDHPQLLRARGYDHTWVLDGSGPRAGELSAAAHVVDPGSGRTLTVFTDQPGVQFYSGNMLDGTLVRRGGTAVRQGDAFCLEPQHFPDSPNRPEFPSTVLRPGETYRCRILLRFGVC
jgi:aldose 1-epimerase